MASSSSSVDEEEGIEKKEPTPLEKHVMFFDINKDGVIYPWETYKDRTIGFILVVGECGGLPGIWDFIDGLQITIDLIKYHLFCSFFQHGFRKIGSGVLLSAVASIFINVGLSGKTRPGKWPSPLFPIEVKNIKFAKHGSDSNIYDTEGRFVPEKFEELFKKHGRTNDNALTATELDELLKANKQPKDFAGHIAAKSEWKILYHLCKDEQGLLPKETVRSVYDGSLFELMAKAKQSKKQRDK